MYVNRANLQSRIVDSSRAAIRKFIAFFGQTHESFSFARFSDHLRSTQTVHLHSLMSKIYSERRMAEIYKVTQKRKLRISKHKFRGHFDPD